MKAAFLSEFTSVRSIVLQMLGIYAIIGLFLCIGMQTSVGMVAAIAAMTPLLMTFTFSSYDSANGWERFRAMLPVSRRAIVVSRYANILLTTIASVLAALAIAAVVTVATGAFAPGSELAEKLAEETGDLPLLLGASVLGMGVTMLFASIILPAIFRFGMNRAMRYVPTAVFVAIMLAMIVLPDIVGTPQAISDLVAWVNDPANTALAVGIAAAAELAVYAASCGVAIALYRTKDL